MSEIFDITLWSPNKIFTVNMLNAHHEINHHHFKMSLITHKKYILYIMNNSTNNQSQIDTSIIKSL